MANISLRQLRYFEALAQHGHFGRAARACAISQPALSVQIKELEDDLGVALFERGPRQVRLTGFGEDFATRVRDILRAVDELDVLARVSRDRLAGRLRLGVIPTIAPYLLPTLIRSLKQHYPSVDIHVRETQTVKLMQELAAGRIDLAIVALPISEPAFTEVSLMTEKFVLVRPASQAGEPVPERDALWDKKLLLLEEGHCFRDQALSFCNVQPSLPREGLDGSSLSTLVQMVGAGIGITLIPEMAVALETGSAEVTLDHFADPGPQRTIGLIWRKTNPLSAQYHEIAGVIRDSARGKE